MTSIFQAGQPFNIVRTSSTTYQANDKDLVISSGDEVALPSPNQGATILVRPAPSIGSVKITTSNGTIGNTGETFGIYRATEPIYLVGDGTDWYARSGGGEISAIPDVVDYQWSHDDGGGTTLTESLTGLDGEINGADWETTARGQSYLSYLPANSDNTTLLSQAQTDLSHFVNNLTGSFACWISPESSDGIQTIFGNTWTNRTAGFALGIIGGSWAVAVEQGDGSTGESDEIGSVTTGSFYPVAFVFDGSAYKVYSGNPLSSEGTGSFANTYDGGIGTDVRFGDSNDATKDNPLDGDIGPAIASSQSMSQSELQQWVNATSDGFS